MSKVDTSKPELHGSEHNVAGNDPIADLGAHAARHAAGGADPVTSTLGMAINVLALTSSPADNGTVYFGMLPKAPVTAGARSKVYIRKAGTIKIAEIYSWAGTAGTNEDITLYVRLNDTTDYEIATVGAAAQERVYSNTALSIAVSPGDYFEIKVAYPSFATNPLTMIYGGYIYIE